MKCATCGVEVPPSPNTGRRSKWTSIKAHDAGWFQQKDGTAYCPDHVPAWVAGWRARKAEQ